MQGFKLSKKKEQAIAALLSRRSINAAARSLNIQSKTLRNWLKDEDFSAAYLAARRLVYDHAIATAQAIASEALAELRKILRSKDATNGDKIGAARTALQFSTILVDQYDTLERLRALEKAIKNGSSNEAFCEQPGETGSDRATEPGGDGPLPE